jgi:hypothetical protein
LAQLRQVLDVLVDAVISHVIGGRLGSQQAVVATYCLANPCP